MPNDANGSDRDPLQLLTVAEVSSLLQVTQEYVYRLCSAGDLRSVKVGKTRRIRRTDLDDFIEDRAA